MRVRRGLSFCALLLCVAGLSARPSFAGKDDMNGVEERIAEIRRDLDGFGTNSERIAHLEGLAEKEKLHFVLYTLSSLSLQEGMGERAEAALREDLARNDDLFDQYESYSLLMGIVIDRKGEIPDREIDGYVRRFDEMKEEACFEREDIERELQKTGGGGAAGAAGFDTRAASLEEKKKRMDAYLGDVYQFERLLGDYYWGRGNVERAHRYYGQFYADLDKPVESFVPESMRRYIDVLMKKGNTSEALVFMGYLVNLRPYMLDDLLKFSDLYYMIGDRVSALLLQMFVVSLSDGYSSEYHERSRGMMGLLLAEMKGSRGNEGVERLAGIFLSGENIRDLPAVIDGLERGGVKNFFFFYLRGVAGFIMGDYVTSLKNLLGFNEFYPYLADSYYYALVCMYNLDLKKNSREIVSFAEKAIELKPGSRVAKATKKYLGVLLGLDENESAKLLMSSEIAAVLNDFLNRGAPVQSLRPLLDSLTVERNPYQVALVQLMSKVNVRKDEYARYLSASAEGLNEDGKRNVGLILSALGTPP
jgi:tetratricopeptide (TPR) repeat protein